jgi:hypothetical protein
MFGISVVFLEGRAGSGAVRSDFITAATIEP